MTRAVCEMHARQNSLPLVYNNGEFKQILKVQTTYTQHKIYACMMRVAAAGCVKFVSTHSRNHVARKIIFSHNYLPNNLSVCKLLMSYRNSSDHLKILPTFLANCVFYIILNNHKTTAQTLAVFQNTFLFMMCKYLFLYITLFHIIS